MQYKLLTGLIISALSTSVWAGSGLVINQSGDNSSSTVHVNQSNSDLSQMSSGSYALVNQFGGALSEAKIDQLETNASLATISQIGDNQRSSILQSNVSNALANTRQSGSDNQVAIVQEASDMSVSNAALAEVTQTGQANTAEVNQLDSTFVAAFINQTGNNNSNKVTQQSAEGSLMYIDMSGKGNHTESIQENSRRDMSVISASGRDNSLKSRQGSVDHLSENNFMMYRAGGDSNSADLAQYGANHSMDVVQNGTSNSVNICQGSDAACNSTN